MRWIAVFSALALLLRAAPVQAQTATDTPTPTPSAAVSPTAAGTATPTPTPSIDPASLYAWVTVIPDGSNSQTGAVVFTITAGEALIAGLQLFTVVCLLILIFQGVRRRDS